MNSVLASVNVLFQAFYARVAQLLEVLAESNPVAEWIDDCETQNTPRRSLQPRTVVFVVPGGNLAVKCFNTISVDYDLGSGTAIAVMLAEMQNQIVSRDLHIDRRVLFELVLPIDGEPEPLDIEFLSLSQIENAKDWDSLFAQHVSLTYYSGLTFLLHLCLVR